VTNYPDVLPCVSRIEGHSGVTYAGVLRTPMTAGNCRQRRTHRACPQRLALVFMLPQPTLATWLAWVNAHAFTEWISLRLPGLAAGQAGLNTTPIPVRFASDLATELVQVHRLWVWRVRVEAEWLPTVGDLT